MKQNNKLMKMVFRWPSAVFLVFAIIAGVSVFILKPGKTQVGYTTSGNRSIASIGSMDIPTGLSPSPLFGAQPFTQKLLMFEEFGLQSLPTANCPTCTFLPKPLDCVNGPTSELVDKFLQQPLNPLPQQFSNQSMANPWSTDISRCLNRGVKGFIEGRPPGSNFAHQRYSEFAPKVYFQSAQTGARTNGGLRNSMQLHHYAIGEFGPGGLYYNTAGAPGFDGTTKGIEPRIHPNMPPQQSTALWTFDGTFPPKLLMARYGTPTLFRHYNALPIDVAANNGFGKNTLSTHAHNGHNPGESDGFAAAFFFPGSFFDYNWPMVLPGHDSINTTATDPHAGYPDGKGGIIKMRGDWRETASSHWFHDHMLDFTAQNVYKGNAAMMNNYGAVDRGREPQSLSEATGSASVGYRCNYANSANINLCLPSGSGLDWGNRDYDMNLVIADKALDQNGQLIFNPFNTDGFLGDIMTVNWQYKPFVEVRARRYRFRILNGSVSRNFKLVLVNQNGIRVPFYLIANDGNLMEHAIPIPNAQGLDLPEQAIAERYDVVIDFASFKEGDRLYFLNTMEHQTGKGPKSEIPLSDILSGLYFDDPIVGKFLEFRVKSYGRPDLSMNPADYVEGKKQMIPLPRFSTAELANAKHRSFEFGRSGGTDSGPWTIKTDGGAALSADPHRVSAAPDKGSVEIWHLRSSSGGWSHPVHVHFEEGQILRRAGLPPPIWEKYARKDVYRLGPLPDSGESVDIAIRFREFMGTFVEHCHNTQHEDHSMLLRWDLDKPGQLAPFLTPISTWDGVIYEDTVTLPTYKSGGIKQ